MYHLYAERANQANKNLYAVSKQCYVKFAIVENDCLLSVLPTSCTNDIYILHVGY